MGFAMTVESRPAGQNTIARRERLMPTAPGDPLTRFVAFACQQTGRRISAIPGPPSTLYLRVGGTDSAWRCAIFLRQAQQSFVSALSAVFVDKTLARTQATRSRASKSAINRVFALGRPSRGGEPEAQMTRSTTLKASNAQGTVHLRHACRCCGFMMWHVVDGGSRWGTLPKTSSFAVIEESASFPCAPAIGQHAKTRRLRTLRAVALAKLQNS